MRCWYRHHRGRRGWARFVPARFVVGLRRSPKVVAERVPEELIPFCRVAGLEKGDSRVGLLAQRQPTPDSREAEWRQIDLEVAWPAAYSLARELHLVLQVGTQKAL